MTVDAATVTANLKGYAISAVGGATWNGTTGTFGSTVSTVDLTNKVLDIQLPDAAGLTFTKLLNPTITLSNFSFNTGTGDLSLDLNVKSAFGNLAIPNQSVLHADTLTYSLGTNTGSAITGSSSAQAVGVLASNFRLSDAFIADMAAQGADATAYGYLANAFKEVKIGTVYTAPPTPQVPEASTYAMMALGLVGMGAVMRRRQQG
jgi:hypothetical protein